MKCFIKGIAEDYTIGLQYNAKSERLTIGGSLRFNDKMIMALVDYFKVDCQSVSGKVTNSSKIKYEVKIDVIHFTEGYSELSSSGAVLIQIAKNLERIWW